MNDIRFGVVGYGNIGSRHVKHIMQHKHAKLVGICEIHPETPDEVHGVPVVRDLDTFLRNTPADVINICTPNYLHHKHTIQALKAGKHVVCEKPMAISTAQCDEMMSVAAACGKEIFVVKQNRYNEPVQQVKELLTNQVLGKIYFVNVNCFWNRNKYYYDERTWRGKKLTDGGCLYTQFSHFIDILYYLFHEVDVLSGVVSYCAHPYTEVEDNGSFILKTKKDNAIVNFNFSTCAYEKNMEGAITILAEKGTVKIGGQYLNTIEYQQIQSYTLPEINIQAKSNDYGQYQGSMSNHDRVIENVIQFLHGQEQIMTNATEGRAVVQIIDQMYDVATIIK